MMVGPWRAAREAARVTQNVTATTLASSRNPETEIKFSLFAEDTLKMLSGLRIPTVSHHIQEIAQISEI